MTFRPAPAAPTPKEARAEKRATCAYIFPDGEACHFPDSYHGRGKGMMPTHAYVPPVREDAVETVTLHRYKEGVVMEGLRKWHECWDCKDPQREHRIARLLP